VSASASENYAAVDPAAALSTEGVEMGQGWGGDVSGVESRARHAEGDGRAGEHPGTGGGHGCAVGRDVATGLGFCVQTGRRRGNERKREGGQGVREEADGGGKSEEISQDRTIGMGCDCGGGRTGADESTKASFGKESISSTARGLSVF
jgi:hypothetical protein